MKQFLSISLRALDKRLAPAFIAAFLVALILPHQVFAAASLGEVFCNVADNMTPFLNVFNMVAYTAGAVFIVQGILHFKNHHENPGQHPHHKSFAMIGAGAALTALPSVVATVVDSLFGMGSSAGSTAGLSVCLDSMSQGSFASGDAQTLDAMMANMVDNIQFPLMFLTSAVAAVMGLFLVVRGLMKAAKYGTDARTTSPTSIISSLVLGAILIAVASSVDVIMQSVTGNGISSITTFDQMNWVAIDSLGGDTSHFKVAIKAALTFIQIVGFISFVRGWNVIRNAVEGSGQATLAQGFTHIIGGVLAINIYAFIQFMDHTFGTNFV